MENPRQRTRGRPKKRTIGSRKKNREGNMKKRRGKMHFIAQDSNGVLTKKSFAINSKIKLKSLKGADPSLDFNEGVQNRSDCLEVYVSCKNEADNDQYSPEEKDHHDTDDSNVAVKVEEVIMKSEINDGCLSDGIASNIHMSADFEMPECDVQIKLEEDKTFSDFGICSPDLHGPLSADANGSDVNIVEDGDIDGSELDSFSENLIQFSNSKRQLKDGVDFVRNKVSDCFRCNKCGKPLRVFSVLERHMEEIHKRIEYGCENCNERFVILYEFDSGENKGEVLMKKNSNLLISKKVCVNNNSNLRSINKLCINNNSNLQNKNYVRVKKPTRYKKCLSCSVCGKNFLNEEHLKSHYLIHPKETVMCSMCDASFVDHDLAKDHLLNHLKEEKFTCVLCEKEFTGNLALKNHIKKHVFEKL